MQPTIPHFENQACDSGAVCFSGDSEKNYCVNKRRFGDLLHLQLDKITIVIFIVMFST